MSSSQYTYNLSSLAYSLPLLHAAAHPSSTVQGVFLANPSAAGTASTGAGRRPLEITEAIPVLHAETTLTPMLEAALEHVEVYAGKKSLVVVGMYEVSEGVSLSRAGKAFLGGIKKSWAESFALTVDIKQLRTGGNPYVMTLASDPSKNLQDSARLSTPGPNATKQTLMMIKGEKLHELLRDFDDHLDDSSAEWLENKALAAAIAKSIK